MFKRFYSVLPALMVVGYSSSLIATERDDAPSFIELADGEVLFTPLLDYALGYDNNVTHKESGAEGSLFSLLSTSGKFERGHALSQLSFDYILNKANYLSSAADNYFDYGAAVGLHHEFTARHRLELNASHNRGHEARGLELSEFLKDSVTDPFEFINNNVNATYGLGYKTAVFNAEFSVGYSQREYQNFSQYTRRQDKENLVLASRFYLKVRPRTALTLDVAFNDTAYDFVPEGAVARDSSVYKILLGAVWDIAGKTEGYGRLGLQSKNFADENRADFTGLTWDLGLKWHPRSYSVFSLETGMEAKDPLISGDYVNASDVKLTWDHHWRKRFSTQFSTYYLLEDYTGIERTDKLKAFSASLEYKHRRWLKFSLTGKVTSQETDTGLLQYDKNLIMASIAASL